MSDSSETGAPLAMVDARTAVLHFPSELPAQANDKTDHEVIEGCTIQLLNACFLERMTRIRCAAEGLKIPTERLNELVGIRLVDGARLLTETEMESGESYENLTPERRKALIGLLIKDDITTKHGEKPTEYTSALKGLGFEEPIARDIAGLFSLSGQIQAYVQGLITSTSMTEEGKNPEAMQLQALGEVKHALIKFSGATNGTANLSSAMADKYLRNFRDALGKVLPKSAGLVA